jgi:citronellol/citronellal dehydrogenase
MSLSGMTMFIPGASRGIGLAIAKKVAADGANVALVAKTASHTGHSLLCEDVLLESGVTNLSVYDCVLGAELGLDLWVDSPNPPGYAPR